MKYVLYDYFLVICAIWLDAAHFFSEKNLGHQEYQYFQPNWLSWERGVKRTLELLKLASHHCGKNTFSSLSCYGKLRSTFILFDIVWVLFRV